MDEQIYKENILDHSRNPRNKTKLETPTHQHTENNPLCGDQITIYLKLENQKIKQITFQGHGCAISQASASILTEYAVGKDLKEITKEKILELLGIPISYAREKCAFLVLKAIRGSQNA